jgi:hypothetical protein
MPNSIYRWSIHLFEPPLTIAKAMLQLGSKIVARERFAAIPLSALLLIASAGVPLVRAADLEEIAPVKELNLSQSLSHRIEPQRQLRHEAGRICRKLTPSETLPLGHTQNSILNAPTGHRLPNGLLAPITC